MSYNLTITSCEQRLQLVYWPGTDFPPFVTDRGRTLQVDRVVVDLQRGPWPEWRAVRVWVGSAQAVGQSYERSALTAMTDDSEPDWLPTLLRQAVQTAERTTLHGAQPDTPAATVPA